MSIRTGEYDARSDEIRHMVADGKKRFRALKKPFAFSQAVELPEQVNKQALGFVLDNLPPYLSKDTVRRLQKYPAPDLTAGVLADVRVFADDVQSTLFPPSVSRIHTKNWFDGMLVLGEIAAEQFKDDVLHTAVERHKVSGLMLEKVNHYLKNHQAYSEFHAVVMSLLRKQNSEKFLETLVEASLTGHAFMLDAYLPGRNSSINDFAITVGRACPIPKDPERKLTPLVQYHDAMETAGNYLGNFPGVIHMPMIRNIKPKNWGELPLIFVHEMGHYLSHGPRYLGLIPLTPYHS